MFGFDLGFGSWDGPAGDAAPPRREQTDALIARMSPPPPAARASLIDALIGALVDAGIWAKLDLLTVLAAHSAQASLLNWKGTANPATAMNGAQFVTDRGWFTDGSDDWLDWGWAPSAGVNFQQNSACFGAWFRKGERNANSPIGTITASSCTLNPRATSDLVAGRINSGTASAGAVTTSGFGLAAIDRSAAASVQCYQNGVASGAASSAASSARSAVAMASGRANNVYADGQFCAHFAGASLTAAQHATLHAAIKTYFDAVGVTAIVPDTRTLSLAAAYLLPDGASPLGSGKGMSCTGLARDPVDGCWWIGNGLATAQPTAGVSRLDPGLTTVLGQYHVAGWGLGSSYNGSVQGVTFDPTDQTLWLVLKATSAGAWLLHMDRAGALIGSPVALPQGASNGIAYDPARDQLVILYDASPATLRWFSKAGVDQSATSQMITLPSIAGDHLWCEPGSGDLLASWGDNGASGFVGRYGRGDYGGYMLRRIDTLTGADAVEGVVLHDSSYWLTNDAATHPGSPALNRILRYAA